MHAFAGAAFLSLGVALLPAAPAPASDVLRASASSQLIQNRQADADHLSRMRDAAMLRRFVQAGLLRPVPRETGHYTLHGIPAGYRYLRPWAKLFLDRLSAQYFSRFKRKLRVTSLVRTAALQKAIARHNGNAAAAAGPRGSAHLTGAAMDISKRGMSQKGVNWMRRVLSTLKRKRHLYAVEEFRQPTFHVMVFRNYPEYGKRLEEARTRR